MSNPASAIRVLDERRRQMNDRNRGRGRCSAQKTTDFVAVDVRHVYVEDDQVDRSVDLRQRFDPIRRFHRLESRCTQRSHGHVTRAGIVVRDQNGSLWRHTHDSVPGLREMTVRLVAQRYPDPEFRTHANLAFDPDGAPEQQCEFL